MINLLEICRDSRIALCCYKYHHFINNIDFRNIYICKPKIEDVINSYAWNLSALIKQIE